MASQQDINNQDELNRRLRETESELKRIKEAQRELPDSFREYRGLVTAINEELGKKVNRLKEASSGYNSLTSIAQKFQNQEESINRLTDKALDTNREKTREALREIQASADQLVIDKQISTLDRNGVELSQEALAVRLQSLVAAGDLTDEEKALLLARQAGFEEEKKLVDLIDIEIAKREESNRLMGIAGGLTSTLTGLLGPLANNLGLKEASEEMQKVADRAAETGESFGKLKVLGAGISSIFGSLGETLTDPTVVIGALIKSFNDFEKANKEVRNLTGQSADNISSANMSLVSATDQAKTIGSLSKEIGINVNAAFGSDTIIAASELTNLLGVSEKSAANLALRAEAFGGSLKGADETVFNTVQGFNMQNRSAVNVGAVLEDVGNASNSLALSLGGSTEELAEAASGAQQLGINLAQAENIADGLLNFEQSIANELEAELLTGKQINLETARQAALNNDIATLTKEIGDNQEILSAFSSGNRIQQDAIAKSLGMSKDEVAKMILLRQKENGLTDEQAAKAAGLSLEAAKRLDAQASIQKSIEKLTTALAPVLAKVADIIAIITNNSAGLVATYSVLALALFPKLRMAAGGFASNIASSVSSAKELVKGIGGAVGRFKGAAAVAGKRGGGLVRRVRSGFLAAAKGGDRTKEIADKAKDVDKAGKVGQTGDSKKIRKFFQDLAAGLRSMGSTKVLAGIGNTILFAPAAVLMVASIPFLSFIGLIKLPFLKSNFKGLGEGLTSLATALPGVAALALFGPAALLATLALPFLAAMAIPGFGALIGTGLGGLATGLTALGTAAATGLPFLAVGLLASIGAAMIPFALSLRLVTPLVEAFGNILIGVFSGIGGLLSTVIDGLVSLSSPEIATGLLMVAPSLAALGLAMFPLSSGLTAFALSAGLLTALTGTSPFGAFTELAESAPGIDMAASALTKMAIALEGLRGALEGVDTEKLAEIMSPSLGGVVLGLGTAAIQGVTDTVDSIAGAFGGEGGGEDPVIAELQAVKEVLNQILEKEGSVMIDSSRAGTAFAMGTSRLQ